jgi:hypothetical protein
MSNLAKTTTDHNEIRRWAEERGGKPTHVKGTGGKGDPGILRIDFPGYSGEGKLEPISWDDFFKKFDEQQLALTYQEVTAEGQKSNFNKLISRHTAEEREAASHKSAHAAGAGHTSSHHAKSSGKK